MTGTHWPKRKAVGKVSQSGYEDAKKEEGQHHYVVVEDDEAVVVIIAVVVFDLL